MAKVLIVEDQLEVAMALARLIEMIGHSAEIARFPQLAVSAALRLQPDVVFMDIGLTGSMDGWELTRTMRGMPSLATVRIYALTARAGREVRRRSKAAGCDGHLCKPLTSEPLDRLLGTRRAAANHPAANRPKLKAAVA